MKQAGFSLVEIMISLALGTIDLTNNSILSENTMSARHNKCHG